MKVMDVHDFAMEVAKAMIWPSVIIDNGSCEDVTEIRIKVENYNSHEILQRLVELLSEMNIVITNVYMCWDGSWGNWRRPMEVLNVTDSFGNKIRDQNVINYIKKELHAIKDGKSFVYCSVRESDKVAYSEAYCSIELTGTDKRGLCKVRGDRAGPYCEMMQAEICTHISQMLAIFRATSLVKQSSCQYLSLKPAQETTASFLFDTLFDRPIPPNLKLFYQNNASNKCTIMSSKIQKKVRVIRLPSVDGKGSKTSRIK
ncbi:ACT domain-containing protein ACR5-like [Silene latifolia]|uniref:ACT domain-containing protein ACR5-like n=1 Tax=Silene latifolia TaxID=37657 RepID=UPI003D785297